MTIIATESHLEANLASLGERHVELAQQLRSTPAADVEFNEALDGSLTATYRGRRLGSQHRPLAEAARLSDRVDIVDNAMIVALGFGLGHHIAALAQRMGKAGVILVFEPDVGLLRAVFERVDCSEWMGDALVVVVTDPEDRAILTSRLQGAEGIIAQGIGFLEHPANRARLGREAVAFTDQLNSFVSNAKTTLLTTLVRSTETVRNQLSNLPYYAFGAGVADLLGVAAGRLGIVVAAGPSLKRNLHLLAQPGVRERSAIIAVQTTLKPMLAAGVRPHFVTALDYHEVSRRFYEGLTSDDLDGITLIVDPKAHPVIANSFPGMVRSCASPFLDKLLDTHARDMGSLPAGATVAHLAFYVARHLGCDPIAFIGQDLGFTDGVYYARGTAIDHVWAPELGPFNTIEMMEWQRIVRHRGHLHKAEDQYGATIYTDAQMLAYLQQFERDFAAAEKAGVTVIDATEGGVRKQHTTTQRLTSVLDQYLQGDPIEWPHPDIQADPSKRRAVAKRLTDTCHDVDRLCSLSRKTIEVLESMLDSQHTPERMDRLFRKLDNLKDKVESIFDAFELINQLNQLAVFKRQRADRRIHLAPADDPVAVQRAQLQRDLENVQWTCDAAKEMVAMLEATVALVEGTCEAEGLCDGAPTPERRAHDTMPAVTPSPGSIAAIVAVDPVRNGLGWPRSVTTLINGRTVLQHTLERLGQASLLDRIILIVPIGFLPDAVVDQDRVGVPVQVERTEGSPFGPEQEAIAAGRAWSTTCWRGGITGLSAWDEALCPEIMHQIMIQNDLEAAIIAAPDWPLIDVSSETGIDAQISRYTQHSDQHSIIFSQGPPGIAPCLISRSLMHQLAGRNRLATIGGLLTYQPHAPQADPIARHANVQVDHRVRDSFVRATCDTSGAIARAADLLSDAGASVAADQVARIESNTPTPALPTHIILELGVQRSSHGLFSPHARGRIERPDLDLHLVDRVLGDLDPSEPTTLTLGWVGDPLCHDSFDEITNRAKHAGVTAVHLRTELRCERATIDRLLASQVDVVSIDLHADRAQTYQTMMGDGRFREVLLNIEYMLDHRRRLTGHDGNAAFCLPWVVPRMQRCRDTADDIESFFDRWMSVLGTAVVEGAPPFDDSLAGSITHPPMASALPPAHVVKRELARRMVILSDGSVPASELDWTGTTSIGSLPHMNLREAWQALTAQRSELQQRLGMDHESTRLAWP